PLDEAAMAEAAAALVGAHDWTTFCAASEPAADRVRAMREARVVRYGRFVELELTGEGFLRGLVRGIAGGLAGGGPGGRPAWGRGGSGGMGGWGGWGWPARASCAAWCGASPAGWPRWAEGGGRRRGSARCWRRGTGGSRRGRRRRRV